MKEFKVGDKVIIKGVVGEKVELSLYPLIVYTQGRKFSLKNNTPALFHDNTEVIDKIVKAAKELLDADWSNYIKKAGRLKEALDDYL